MKKTFKTVKFVFTKVEKNEKGEYVPEIGTITVFGKNEKKALKKAWEQVGRFYPVDVITGTTTYTLSDEDFVKYGTPVNDIEG